ncbi:hypothetical protein [Nonomuraea sp. NPDC049400]|uniref:hypothetical protein n=1 Tax=Nonomuraea sp. NPDC049400 TaxID=3364352 RepID=UPI0037B38028
MIPLHSDRLAAYTVAGETYLRSAMIATCDGRRVDGKDLADGGPTSSTRPLRSARSA